MLVAGFIVLLIAGLCQGSFGLGYKKYPPYSWAGFWCIYCLLCIVVSTGAALMLAPELLQALCSRPASYYIVPVLSGCLWGLSAVGFSKGISMIGMSLVYGISMGISTVVGSVLPMLMNHDFPTGISAAAFALQLLFTIVGVILVTRAGVMRDGGSGGALGGILLSIFSGLGSGAMNLGFRYTKELGQTLTELGYGEAAISAGMWLPVLVGGCSMGALYCMGELTVKKQWGTLVMKGSLKRIGVLFMVSLIWYGALLLYGVAVDMLGTIGTTVGWILFNALALVISVGWGLKVGEWKNAGGAKKILFAGCIVLIVSWILTMLI